MNTIPSSHRIKMLPPRPSSNHSKSIYGIDLVDERAKQDIYTKSTRESIQGDFVLIDQYGLGSFLPNDRHLMAASEARVADMKYSEWLARNNRHTGTPLPISKEELPCIGGLVFVPIRDLTYLEAMNEIRAYIEKVGNRRVYISELAEELQIDMDLIEEILREIRRSSGIDSYA